MVNPTLCCILSFILASSFFRVTDYHFPLRVIVVVSKSQFKAFMVKVSGEIMMMMTMAMMMMMCR